MAKTRFVHDGIAYHTIGAAAKMLRTSTATIKRLMGENKLEWLNLRVNGRLLISEASILDYQRHLLWQKRHQHQENRS